MFDWSDREPVDCRPSDDRSSMDVDAAILMLLALCRLVHLMSDLVFLLHEHLPVHSRPCVAGGQGCVAPLPLLYNNRSTQENSTMYLISLHESTSCRLELSASEQRRNINHVPKSPQLGYSRAVAIVYASASPCIPSAFHSWFEPCKHEVRPLSNHSSSTPPNNKPHASPSKKDPPTTLQERSSPLHQDHGNPRPRTQTAPPHDSKTPSAPTNRRRLPPRERTPAH